MPFFNAEKTLKRAIKSIKDQSLEDFECLLINNNSTDKSLTFAQEISNQDIRFKILNEKKQGVVHASNTGIKKSKGKYIARMDSDDIAIKERLEYQNKFLDNNKDYDIISSKVIYQKDDDIGGSGLQNYVEWSNNLTDYDEISYNRFVDLPVINPTLMWRKEIFDKYGYFKEGFFPEDYELFLRLLNEKIKIKKLNNKLLYWHDSHTRLTRINSKYSEKAFYNIKTKYLYNWLQEHNAYFPEVVIWGAGKISRKRAELLENTGIKIKFYIDIKRTRQIKQKLLYYENLKAGEKIFILIYVKQFYAKDKIRNFLKNLKYTEGKDFLFIS